MITKEQFNDIITAYKNFEKWIEQLRELGVDLIDSELYTEVGILFDNAIYSNFNEQASDFIMWWMFEDTNKTIEVNNKLIEISTIDALWSYLKSCGYVE